MAKPPKNTPAGSYASGATGAAKSKTKAASSKFNQEIASLLQLASSTPALTFPQRKSAAKLYELAILAELFFEYRRIAGNKIKLVQPTNGTPSTFAGSPASANKKLYAWFELSNSAGKVEAEAWVSVQFVGLSANLARKNMAPAAVINTKASMHELDLSLIAPEKKNAGSPRLYPPHTALLAGVSVKHTTTLEKASVREALGFRREMGYFGAANSSRCAWLKSKVPCDPPSPLFLASSAAGFQKYDGHIDQLGIYPVFMKFPY